MLRHLKKYRQKQELRLLDRLGWCVKLQRFTLDSGLDEMQAEYKRITERRAVEQSVKFLKMLIAFVTANQFLNNNGPQI